MTARPKTPATTEANRKLAKGILVNALGVAAKASRAAFLIVFSRLLGAELFGLYMLAYATQEIVSKVAVLGLDKGTMRAAGALCSHGRRADVRATVLRIAGLVLASSVVAAVALAVSAGWVSSALLSQPGLARPLRIFAIGLPTLCLTYTFLFAIRATMDMRYEVFVQSLVEPLLVFALGTAALLGGLGVTGAAAAHVAASFVAAGLALRYFLRLFPPRPARTRGSTGGSSGTRRSRWAAWTSSRC